MQEALFLGFTPERHVPDNHMLRKIDFGPEGASGAVLKRRGTASIDLELIMRTLIVG
jgi:hypothetical protein